ncbi:high affinity cAMP-specific and IBMX-insensitive 3',5'-cyclic phosphodiesterase 8 isoform X1 [Drosophila busckii]|uniref:high affinity cAMP-specific and IBMX-insensitive 3',5'-cyclic phosphodiesterase 8 isoform X1 n=1 Tax=Drosophila busckii TaxID=30019 RepID=UPI00083EB24D|nr:high affinity cAMP-specific and IBMX-insensitive 3',5'-cyclic phosphodiesterase 8 isoform X1 [Drosophila busckii]
MRNCLPKIASVFRSKSSTAAAAAAATKTHSNESDAESDTEQYEATKAKVMRETDQLLDNDNKKLQQWQAAKASTTTATTISSSSSSFCAADVAEQLISSVDLEPNGSIRSNLTAEIAAKVVASKTPEQIELEEYEANVAAEGEDIMTPLPRQARSASKAFAAATAAAAAAAASIGRNMQPEIVEAIRSLDNQALRLNNLTLEDKQQLTSAPTIEELPCDAVVLRPPKAFQFDRQCRSLYERRLHKGPKLHLWVGTASSSDSEDYKQFQRNLVDLKYPTVLPPNPQLKALLVFHKADSICEAVTLACQRHQLDVTLVKSKDEALDTLQKSYANAQCYHLIIVDARSTKGLDAEYIARSIRTTHGHHLTTIIAVCKKSFFEKDDALIALLDAGVNRCIAETTNLAMCSVELKQILHSIIRPNNVMSTQQALYTALHRLKEVVLITDDVLRIQYANRATERLLNMRLDEIISKPLADIFVSDLSTISEQGKGIKEFDGILTVRRKNQEGIPMHVRVVPVACIGSAPTHLIFNFDIPGGGMDFIATLPQPKEAPRGSLHSVRRCSFDVRSIASDGLRRTSLAKLTSLPLEAPITKIINLLSQVQDNCSADEARLIDKVLEFLKREGLYSPQMKEIRTDDPIATDLIGALLTGPSVYSSRRSSNDSIIRSGNSTRTATIVPAKMKVGIITKKKRKCSCCCIEFIQIYSALLSFSTKLFNVNNIKLHAHVS